MAEWLPPAGPVTPRLRTASGIVIAAGFLALALAGMLSVYYGFYRMLKIPSILAIVIARSLAVPAAYIALGFLLRRGWFPALPALILISSAAILSRFVDMLAGPRDTALVWLAADMVVPIAVLGGALLACGSRTMSTTREAVWGAQSRAGIGLRIVAIGLYALAGLILVNGIGDRAAFLLVISAAGLAAGAGMKLYAAGTELRANYRPEVGRIVFAFFIGAIVLGIVNQMPLASFGLRHRWMFAWFVLLVNAGATWLGTNLLHARAVVAQPKSYGFTPIVGQPVPVVPVEEPPVAE